MSDICVVCNCKSEGKPLYKKVPGFHDVEILEALWHLEWSDLTEADKADHYICWDCDEVLAETYTRYLEEQPLKKKKNVLASKSKTKREEKKKKSKLGRKERNVPILKISRNYVELKVKSPSKSPSKPSYSKLCSKPPASPVKKCKEYDASHCMLCDNVFEDVHRGFNRFPLKKMVDDRKDVAQVIEFLGITRLTGPGVKNRRFICTTCFQVLRRSYKAKKNPGQDSQDGLKGTEESVKKLSIHRASAKEHADEISKLIPPDLADLYKVVTEETITSSSDPVHQSKQMSLSPSKSNGTLQKTEFGASDITSLQNSSISEEINEIRGEHVKGENIGNMGVCDYSSVKRNPENAVQIMAVSNNNCSNEVDNQGNPLQTPLKDNIKKGIKIHRPIISKYHVAGTTRTPKKTLKVHRPQYSTEEVDEHRAKDDVVEESSDSNVGSSSSDDEDICPEGICNICGRTYTGMPYEWWFSLETVVEGYENISLKEALVVLQTGLAEVDESVRKSGLVCRMCCGMVNSGYTRLQGVQVEKEISIKEPSCTMQLSQKQTQKLWKEDKVELVKSDSLLSGDEASEIAKTDSQSYLPQKSVPSGFLSCSDSAETNDDKNEVDGTKNFDKKSMNPKVVLQDLTPVLPDIAFKYLTVSCEEVLGKLNNNYVRRKSCIPEQARDLDVDPCKIKAKTGSTFGMYKCVYCTEKKSKRLDWHDSGDSFNTPGIDVALKWAIVALGKKSRTSTIKERNKVCHCCYTKILVDFKKFLQEQIAKSVGMEVHQVDLALYQVKVDTNTCNLVIDPVSLSEDEAEGDDEKMDHSSGTEESDSECETSAKKHQEGNKEVVNKLGLVQSEIKHRRHTSASKQDGEEQETFSCKSPPLQTGQHKPCQSSRGENIHEPNLDEDPKEANFEYSKGSRTPSKKDGKYSHPSMTSKENVISPCGTKRNSEEVESTSSKKQVETLVMTRSGRRVKDTKRNETFKEIFNKFEDKEETSSMSDPLEYIDDSDEDFQVSPNIKVTAPSKARTSRRLSEKRGMDTGANHSIHEHRVRSYSGDVSGHDRDKTSLSKSIPKVVKQAINIGKASGKRVLTWDVENVSSKPDQITEECAHHVFSLLLSIDIDGLVNGHNIPRLKIEEFSKGLLLLLCDLQSHFGAPVTDVGLWLDSLMPQELVSKGFSIDYPSVLRFLETGLENVNDVLVPLPEELYKKIPNMSVESTSLSTVMGCLSAVGLDHLVLGSVTRLTWKDFTHGFVYSLSKFCEMTAINDNLLMDWLQALSPGSMLFTLEDLKNIVAEVEENPQSYQILSKPVFVPKSSVIEQDCATTAAASGENDLSRIHPKRSMEIQRETVLHSGHSDRKHVHRSGTIKKHHTEHGSALESPSLKEVALCEGGLLSREEGNHIALSQMESKSDESQVNKRKLDKFDVHSNSREQESPKSQNVIFKNVEKVLQSDFQSEKIGKEETKNKRQKLSLRNLDRKPQCRQDVISKNNSVEDCTKKDVDVVIEKREGVESEKSSDDPKNRNIASSVLSSKSRRSSVFKRKKMEKIASLTKDQQELSEQSKYNTCNHSTETETLVYCKRRRKLSDSETKNENSLTDQNKANTLSSSDKGKIHKPLTEKTVEDSISSKESNPGNKKHICVTPRNLGNNTIKKRPRTFEEALNMGSV